MTRQFMAPLFHMTVCVPREEVATAMPWGLVGDVVTGGEFAHLSLRLWVFPLSFSLPSFSEQPKAPPGTLRLFFPGSKNSSPTAFQSRFFGLARSGFIPKCWGT